ncbi:MAG: hypothetical protein WA324_03000 [Bryobacteraceae bacterium]
MSTGVDGVTRLASAASNECMQCPEYKNLWAAYIDAECDWRDIIQAPALSIYATRLREQATIAKDTAKERAEAHKRQCLLCANVQANDKKSA